MQLIFKITCSCTFIFLQILIAGRLINDFRVSTAILNLVDIFRRWCKLNFGPMRDQAKQPCFSERISVGRQYFHFLCKYLGIICQKRLGKPFQKLIWIYYYILSRIQLDLDLHNSSAIRNPPGNKTSQRRRDDVSLYVPATSQVRLK